MSNSTAVPSGSLRNKLLSLAAIGMLLVILASAYALLGVQQQIADKGDHFTSSQEQLITLLSLQQRVRQIIINGQELPKPVATGSSAWGDLIREIEAVERTIQQLRQQLPAAEQAALQSLSNEIMTWQSALGDGNTANLRQEQRNLLRQIDSAAEAMIRQQRDAANSQIVASRERLRNAIIFICITLLLAATLFVMGLQRLVIQPATTTVGHLKRLGQRDVSHTIAPAANDELGAIAHGAEQIRQTFINLFADLDRNSNQLDRSVEQLSEVIEITRSGVNRQRQETDSVADAINRLTQTVQEMANAGENAANQATSADDSARQGQRVVNQTLDAISHLVKEIEDAATTISKLEQESSKIASVIDTIRGISEQTNLLALNASIEAARAGEQGRGFAVVADEVRALANRTGQATGEISDTINRLLQGTRNAVQVMESSQGLARRTLDQSDQTGIALDAITTAVGQISRMNQQIAAASNNQRIVAEEINRNILNIVDIAEHSTEGAKRIDETNRQLTAISAQLRQLVATFHR
jgi:methyl-accepting chemotaxis protein